MKMFLLVLTLLLASNGEQYSHEHGFSALSSPAEAAVFKLPELVLHEQDQDTEFALPGIHTTPLIHLAAFAAHSSAAPAAPRQPVIAGHPIRGPPTAHV